MLAIYYLHYLAMSGLFSFAWLFSQPYLCHLEVRPEGQKVLVSEISTAMFMSDGGTVDWSRSGICSASHSWNLHFKINSLLICSFGTFCPPWLVHSSRQELVFLWLYLAALPALISVLNSLLKFKKVKKEMTESWDLGSHCLIIQNP